MGGGGLRVGGGSEVLVLVLDDPPEAPAQPEGDPENEGLPTATGRFTRSRPRGSKRAARGSTPSHRGPTLAGFLGAGGGGGGYRVGVVVVLFLGGGGGSVGMCMGAAGHRAGVRCGAATQGCCLGLCWGATAAQRRSVGLCWGAAWGCAGAGAQRVTEQGRSMWSWAGAHWLHRGRSVWLLWDALGDRAGGLRRTAQGRSVGPRRGAACGCVAWSWAGAQRLRKECSVGLRSGGTQGCRRGAAGGP